MTTVGPRLDGDWDEVSRRREVGVGALVSVRALVEGRGVGGGRVTGREQWIRQRLRCLKLYYFNLIEKAQVSLIDQILHSRPCVSHHVVT